jgi:chemotaxis response regulator CheB
MIRVAIFDDNKTIRNSIVLLSKTDERIEVVGIYSNSSRCIDVVLFACPDLVPVLGENNPRFKG